MSVLLFGKLAVGAPFPLHISLLCVECRREKTLIGHLATVWCCNTLAIAYANRKQTPVIHL